MSNNVYFVSITDSNTFYKQTSSIPRPGECVGNAKTQVINVIWYPDSETLLAYRAEYGTNVLIITQ